MLKAGDRVAYVQGHPSLYNPRFFGKTGTIQSIYDGHAVMKWDGERESYRPSHYLCNLQPMSQPIDETESFFV